MVASSSTAHYSWEYLNMPKRKLRAAAYPRCSDPKLKDSATLESQTDDIRRYCKAKGYNLAEEHIFPEAHTAYYKSYREREQFQKLLTAARRGEIDVVVVQAFSRLSRRQIEQAVIIDMLEKMGVKVESCTEEFETSAIGTFMRQTVAFASELEVEHILERTDRGRRKKATYGLLGQGDPLYGYKFADLIIEINGKPNSLKSGRYEYDEQETAIVDRVFLMSEEGMSNRKIALTLTQEGVPTRHGGPWAQATISQMLRRREYMGKGYVFRTYTDGNGTEVDRPQEEWVELPEDIIPPIISPERFERVQERLKENKSYSSRSKKTPPSELLRCGHAICGICGYRMHVQRNSYVKKGCTKPKPNEYFCRKNTGGEGLVHHHNVSITVHHLDAAAWELAVKYIKDPSLIANRVEQLREAHKITDDGMHIASQLEEVRRKIANLYKLAEAATDDDTMNSLSMRLRDLEKQKRDLEGMLSDIEEEDEIKQMIQEEINHFEAWADKVRPCLGDPMYQASYDEKVLAIRVLGIRARVYLASYPERFELEVAPPQILRVANVGVRSRCNSRAAW